MSVVKTRLSVSVDTNLAKKLDNYSAQSMIPKARIINKALELYLAEYEENQADYTTAVKSWNEYVVSGKSGITNEELRKKYNL